MSRSKEGRPLTGPWGSPIGSLPSQIHSRPRSGPSLFLMASAEAEGRQHRRAGQSGERGVEDAEACFSALAYLPQIGHCNGPLVLEAFPKTPKSVDLWRWPNRRAPVTGKWSSFRSSSRVRGYRIVFEVTINMKSYREKGFRFHGQLHTHTKVSLEITCLWYHQKDKKVTYFIFTHSLWQQLCSYTQKYQFLNYSIPLKDHF